MQCAHCGFGQPGAADACPSCGRAIRRAGAAVPPARVSSNTLHLITYLLLIFGIVRVYASLWERYVAAEQERVESLLASQSLDHKRQVLAAERAAEDAGS